MISSERKAELLEAAKILYGETRLTKPMLARVLFLLSPQENRFCMGPPETAFPYGDMAWAGKRLDQMNERQLLGAVHYWTRDKQILAPLKKEIDEAMEQETSSLDTFKLPTDEQVERATSLIKKANTGHPDIDMIGERASVTAFETLIILLNKDRILGYDRL